MQLTSCVPEDIVGVQRALAAVAHHDAVSGPTTEAVVFECRIRQTADAHTSLDVPAQLVLCVRPEGGIVRVYAVLLILTDGVALEERAGAEGHVNAVLLVEFDCVALQQGFCLFADQAHPVDNVAQNAVAQQLRGTPSLHEHAVLAVVADGVPSQLAGAAFVRHDAASGAVANYISFDHRIAC